MMHKIALISAAPCLLTALDGLGLARNVAEVKQQRPASKPSWLGNLKFLP